MALFGAVAAVIIAVGGPPPRGSPAALPGPAALSGPDGEEVCSVAFSPDGKTLAVAGCDGRVWLRNIAARGATARNAATQGVATQGVAARRWTAARASPACPHVGQVAFSPDGKTLALFGDRAVSPGGDAMSPGVRDGGDSGGDVGHDPVTCLWNAGTRRETALADPRPLAFDETQGAFSPNGTMLAVTDNSGNIYLWNLAARRVTATVPASGYCGPVCPVAFSPDGKTLAVGETAGDTGGESSGETGGSGTGGEAGGGGDHIRVRLWDLSVGRWTATLTNPGSGPVTSLDFSRDGTLAVGGDDHVYLWDAGARTPDGVIAPPVDVARGNASIAKDGHPYPVAGAFDKSATATFSPSGTILAVSVSFGYGTYLYDVATGNRAATLTGPCGQPGAAGTAGAAGQPGAAGAAGLVERVVFGPSGAMAVIAGTHGRACLWPPRPGQGNSKLG